MKIESSNPDEVSAVITVTIVKDDYAKSLETQLKEYRKRASIPGFRQGKVPLSVVNKMYGKSVLLDVVNKVLSENLFEYIREQNINLLGEPLPTENFPTIDLDQDEDFNFSFDIALAPDLTESFKLSKKDKIDIYNIPVTEEEIQDRINNYKAQFGAQVSIDAATEDTDLIKVNIVELENKKIKDGGISVTEVMIAQDKIVDKVILKKITGINKGSVISFKPYKAYKNENEVAGMLKIETSQVENYIDTEFQFTVIDILRFEEAALNQDLFDKVYGSQSVATEEEFRAKIGTELSGLYAMETAFEFMTTAKQKLQDKLKDFKVADAILKRWILASNEEMSIAEVEEHYPSMIKDLKWQLIKSNLVKTHEIKITPEDELQYAKKIAKIEFLQYGMVGIPTEIMDNYATRMLQDEEKFKQIRNGALEEKIIDTVKPLIKLNEISISHADFIKLDKAE